MLICCAEAPFEGATMPNNDYKSTSGVSDLLFIAFDFISVIRIFQLFHSRCTNEGTTRVHIVPVRESCDKIHFGLARGATNGPVMTGRCTSSKRLFHDYLAIFMQTSPAWIGVNCWELCVSVHQLLSSPFRWKLVAVYYKTPIQRHTLWWLLTTCLRVN